MLVLILLNYNKHSQKSCGSIHHCEPVVNSCEQVNMNQTYYKEDNAILEVDIFPINEIYHEILHIPHLM